MLRNEIERKVELDVYLPDENLAFEYQGQQHYSDIYALGHRWYQKQKDEEKRRICKDKGITLIEVPYWWDNTKSSLVATIHKFRPDLLPTSERGTPIPNEPPKGFPKGTFGPDYHFY